MHDERAALRTAMRARRRGHDIDAKNRQDSAIRSSIKSLGAYRRAKRVAMFFAFDGEPALAELMIHAVSAGKEVYVPVISGDRMDFAAINGQMRLVENEFGILEPQGTYEIAARELDLVLTPLVAYDGNGTRIGVGRAYYDRCFAFLSNRSKWRQPKLLGVAYGFQKVELQERAAWDVPLWGVATETGVQVFTQA